MVEDDLRAFNVERLYATDVGDADVGHRSGTHAADAAAAPHRDRADGGKAAGAEEEGRRRAKDDGRRRTSKPLIDYFGSPSPETTLILVCSPGRHARRDSTAEEPSHHQGGGRSRDGRHLQPAWTAARTPSRWVQERAKASGLEIDRQAVAKLVDLAGRRSRAAPRGRREAAAVCVGQREGHARPRARHRRRAVHHGDDWALVRALEQQDAATALRELQASLNEDVSPFLILGPDRPARSARRAAAIPPRRIPVAVDAIFRTDQAMKSSGGDPKVLLERLIVEMCG